MIPAPVLAICEGIWKYRRLVGYAAAAIAIVWFAWAKIHAYGDRRESEGRAAVQALWDVERANAIKAAKGAESARIASEAATAARNQEIEREHQEKLAAARRDNARLERMLQHAIESAASGGGNPEVAGSAGAVEAGPPGSDDPAHGAAGVAADIAAALTEARENAEQLDALIQVVRGQM